MTSSEMGEKVELDLEQPIWNRTFTVAPLVVIGTREGDGYNLAPKHMATPLGWDNLFGFVCTPSHGTYQNIRTEEAFTVSFPLPSQVVVTSLTAQPRCGEDEPTPGLDSLPTEPAQEVDGIVLRDAYLVLECRLERIVDDFGSWSLIAGEVVAARALRDSVRKSEVSDERIFERTPLLAYLSPGRYAEIRDTREFPFPAGFKR
ncbi:MAG: flavin reductase [Longimicrobiales bacterium]|nr:flavin reductase [Longimicrobiales bacterium]